MIDKTVALEGQGENQGSIALIGQGMLGPFMLVTTLFALWGFANDVTNPLVKAFKEIFLISNTQSSLVQFAFYFGYFTMALPAALFIRKYSYKTGILIGLGLYAAGALLAIPASLLMNFWIFILAFYILTFGLAFLETTANPYILSMGPEETATRRLNLAQAFNPMGSLTGMMIASSYILAELQVLKFENTEAVRAFAASDPSAHQAMQLADLAIVRGPYIAISGVILFMMVVFVFSKMPDTGGHSEDGKFGDIIGRLTKNKNYYEGVIAQAFYVGAQIMCWTYIIHYATETLGLSAESGQKHNIAAMILFLCSRFICTFLLGYIKPSQLLLSLAVGATGFTFGAIFLEGMVGLYSLVGISACMSLMFPTIYGIALDGLGDDAKLGSAGLVMAIVGGALMPVVMGALIDAGPIIDGMHPVKSSFFLPIVCFAVVALYAYRAKKRHLHEA
ncbi:MAG: L-fucose:H+ symporter permease [Alphaproteobacteria bacterium]|nr:MAG: L-fucose:H+ symporter permease [Alphaproteobacteria bacterium]